MKIINGLGEIFEVSKGAYEDIYSKQGFKPYNKGNIKEESKSPNEEQNESPDDKFLEMIKEKPLSQWNKNETKKFASLNGIDISGTRNVHEAKAIIKEFLEELEESNSKKSEEE